MNNQHLDVLIIGAGLSGIGAAAQLRRECPKKSFALIERRSSMGGTWDLFRYPGIRSDSDMFTLGYSFKPWKEEKSIASGGSILNYIKETAADYKLDDHVHYGRKVVSVSWSTPKALWTVTTEQEKDGTQEIFTCNYLIGCTGYYNYDAGFTPNFPGVDNYKGQIVHPQKWSSDIDYSNKKVVIIGSGATAVTLIPAMADATSHITMLQRSPTYVATVPEKDIISIQLRKFLPEKLVYKMARTRNVGIQRAVYKLSKHRPKTMRSLLLAVTKRQLGPDFDMKHFTPTYNPWEERLCAVPNGDLFKVLKEGKASVVTDTIKTFTETGILLTSGEALDADIIVTATGLDLQMLGGITPTVDGKDIKISESLIYKGAMLSRLPNLSMIFGYTNSSWTLKADMVNEFTCRLLNHMEKEGISYCVPEAKATDISTGPFLDLQSGYVVRAADKLPRQGNSTPWKVVQDYFHDIPILKYSQIDDGILLFSESKKRKQKGLFSNIRASLSS
ncbi:FAD-containing monooxygenase EthA [Gammaproteobacteria bacterium 42_54_T18]|nr:FAD-containing monooxygenase EthA [Gammaproteobacteria bacterium 42_54_T18]